MGYSHYLRNQITPTESEWNAVKSAVHALYFHAQVNGVQLANGIGEAGTFPEIDDDYISFNGVGGGSHESCHVERGAYGFSFCKTNNKPYDTYVVALYHVLQKVGVADWNSDGDKEETADGVALGNQIWEIVK